jgi:hypothetical protein
MESRHHFAKSRGGNPRCHTDDMGRVRTLDEVDAGLEHPVPLGALRISSPVPKVRPPLAESISYRLRWSHASRLTTTPWTRSKVHLKPARVSVHASTDAARLVLLVLVMTVHMGWRILSEHRLIVSVFDRLSAVRAILYWHWFLAHHSPLPVICLPCAGGSLRSR